MTLCEELGYAPDAKLLIVSCDDLGSSHAANAGVYRSLRDGWASTAGLMVPGPWAREAAARYRGEDIGVHLTLNADYELFRWGPVTQAPSLLGGDGGFPRTVNDLWEHADTDECRRECRAQLERAIYWGFDVTHLDSHLGALTMRPEFFDVLVELAIDFDLPIRLPSPDIEQAAGFPFRKIATEEGIVYPDRLVSLGRNASRHAVESALNDLMPGVTEFALRPAADTPELRALTDDWPSQAVQSDLLGPESELPAFAAKVGATIIGYRPLREAQRRRRAKSQASAATNR